MRIGGQNRVFENCLLWLGKADDRAHLMPDNMKSGAYRLDDQFILREVKRLPIRASKAEPGMVRAYQRLLDLQAEHWDSRASHPVPQQLRELEAA